MVPIRDETDRWHDVQERQRQDELVHEADRLGVEHRGRTLESVERDVNAAQDHQHAQAHGHEVEHLPDLADVRKAADIDEGAVERMAIAHGDDLAGFKMAVKEFLNAHERGESGAERAGAEPGPGRTAEQPALRGEHPASAAMAAGRNPIRGEQSVGGARPEQRAAGGPEVPGAGAERGGAATAEAGKPVETSPTTLEIGHHAQAMAVSPEEAYSQIEAINNRRKPQKAGAAPQQERRVGPRDTPEERARKIEAARPLIERLNAENDIAAAKPRDFSDWDPERLQRMADLVDRRIEEERKTAETARGVGVDRSQAAIARLTKDKTDLDAELAKRAGERPAMTLEPTTPEGDRMKAALTEKAAESERQLENAPPPEDFRLTGSKRPADELEARGQKPLFMKAAMDYVAKAAKGVATMHDARAALNDHIENVKAWLDRAGLPWVHENTDYRVMPAEGVAGASARTRLEGTRFAMEVDPLLLAEHPNVVAQTMLHEHAHIMDWLGGLYSQDPALQMYANAKPLGAAARELVDLFKNDPQFERFLQYPLGTRYDGWQALHADREAIRGELFAQAVVAYNTPLREVMEREAPETAKLVAAALKHAADEGVLPRIGAEGTADLGRLSDSFAAARSGDRPAGAAPPAAGDAARHLEGVIRAQKKVDSEELKKYREILSRSYPPDQLKRMGEASREEDAMLESGKYEPGKGLNSLPADQKEVMEFLQGKGYTRKILPYSAYQGVVQQGKRGGEGGIGDAVRKVFAPASRGPQASQMEGIMRANFGEQARERELAMEKLKSYAARYDKMSPAAQVGFTDAVERGRALPDSKMQADARVLREFYDTRRDEIRELGTGALDHFNENYVGHAWTEPERAVQDIYSVKRPLEGSKAFLKKRTVPYTTDGLRWRAYDEDGAFVKSFDSEAEAKEAMPEGGRIGKPLTPITANPFEMALIKGREMDRYLYGQRVFKEMQMGGLARFVPYGTNRPTGWIPINDKIARSLEQSKDADGKPQGPVQRGVWHAPEEAARLINNHLSPGWRGNSLFEAWRSIGNMLNQVQLGLSLYHVGFTAMDSMASRVTLGVKQISRGDVVPGFGNILMGLSPHQPFENLYKGDKLLKAYLGRLDSPEMAPIVAAIQDAGGRIRQDDFYRNVEVNAFKNAWNSGDVLTAAKTALPRALDLINAPIFEHLVPRQKLGVFFDMAKDWLAKNPDAGVDARREGLGKLWDSVDNRMGQLVYDNLFWNKTLKDGLMATVRSVGWNLGTIRELGGGLLDMKDAVKGKGLSDRAAYVIGLPILAGVYGAITQALYTHKAPDSLEDLYFPKTGRTRPDGSADRVSLPTYMKDVAAYAKDAKGFVKYGSDPLQTLENKTHPLLSTVSQMLHNQDFFGAAIRNYQQQAASAGEKPSIGGWMSSPSMVGITPAPGYITKSPEQEQSAEIGRLREPLMRKFREELQGGAQADQAMVRRMSQSGLSRRDIEYVIKSSGAKSMPHRPHQFGVTP